MKYLFLFILLLFCFSCFHYADSLPAQNEFYPIIFLHGHGGDISVEDTWLWMVQNKLSNQGFSYYGKIWSQTVLPQNLASQTIFLGGFYRTSIDDPMGKKQGKIGAIPITRGEIPSIKDDEIAIHFSIVPPLFWYDVHTIEYVDSYFEPNRDSYAQRLKEMVDNVLNATKAKKVILVTHSMGGLVARAYIKWLGGDKCVYKLLTIGAPNHGIATDGRAAMEKFGNSQVWQFGGEYLEMSTRPNFKGKSYTDWLNDGWTQLCQSSHVQYATIAGNYNPWPAPIKIGNDSDGVIDSGSVKLEGAVFNGKSETAHTQDLPFSSIDDERSMLRSTYTAEIIKRWLFYNKVNLISSEDIDKKYTLIANSPSGANLAEIQVVMANKTSTAVCATLALYDGNAHKTMYSSWPLFPGTNQGCINISMLSNGAYIANINVYDMNGNIQSVTQKIVKGGGSDIGKWGASATLVLDVKPPRISSSVQAAFGMRSSEPGLQYAYQLDDNPQTNYTFFDKDTINLANLSKGLHRIYIRGFKNENNKDYVHNSLEYYWIVGDLRDFVLDGQVISGKNNFYAEKTISIKNSTFDAASQTKFGAGQQITLEQGVQIEQGASCNIEIK